MFVCWLDWIRRPSVCAKSLQLCPTLQDPMDCSPSGSSVHGFPREKYWSGLPCPSAGDLLNLGIETVSLVFPAFAGRFFTTSTTWEEGPESWSNITSECVCEGVSKKRLAFDSVA